MSWFSVIWKKRLLELAAELRVPLFTHHPVVVLICLLLDWQVSKVTDFAPDFLLTHSVGWGDKGKSASVSLDVLYEDGANR